MTAAKRNASALIDQLVIHWRPLGHSGDLHLVNRAISLTADPSRGDGVEKVLLAKLRTLLNDEEWNNLPKTIAYRFEVHKQDQVRIEKLELLRQQQERQNAERLQMTERIRQRRESMKRDEERRVKAQDCLLQCIRSDFLRADSMFTELYSRDITETEYQALKIAFVRQWVEDNLPEINGKRQIPDDEQLAAIAAVSGHVQVIARAGSGKTATLVNRTFFMIRHCKVPPSAILILAFNRKAAQEIQSRLAEMLQIESESMDPASALPHVMTFHALAYAIVHPEETLLYDDSESDAKQLSRAFQQVIDDHIRDKHYGTLVRELMLLRWRTDWERIDEGGYTKDKDDFLRYRRSLSRQSIDGTYVKSFGEKAIANFLFENNIKYRYEQNHWWRGKNYRPDFTIPTSSKSGIVIEYFGLSGDPDYDEMAQGKREYWNTKPEWQLLEYTPADINSGGIDGFQARLERDLRERGINSVPLSEDEIWYQVRERAIDDFTKASRNFAGRCRQQSLSPNALRELVNSHRSTSVVETKFLELAWILYSAYIARLASAGEEDFSGLLQRATQSVNQGVTGFWRKQRPGNLRDVRYLCIDEFQDFSDLFYRLLCAIKKVNPDVGLFCVGDDWQAINGFAGSDLKFFEDFESHLGAASKFYIATNYRSSPETVALGNSLMADRGKPASSVKRKPGRILVADLNKFEPEVVEREQFEGDVITPAASRLIAHAILHASDIALLSRRNGLPQYVNIPDVQSRNANGIQAWGEFLKSNVPEEQRGLISISTVHKYKGLERNTVIVLDAIGRSYPLVHPDWVFTRILGDSIEKIIDAERRLLYVAITRAVDTLVIVTDSQDRSPFLEEIERRHRLTPIDWSEFPVAHDSSSYLEVRVKNRTSGSTRGGTYPVKDLLKASQYRWLSTSRCWAKSWPMESFAFDLVKGEVWADPAIEVEVQILNSGVLLAVYLKNDTEWICKFDQLQPNADPKY